MSRTSKKCTRNSPIRGIFALACFDSSSAIYYALPLTHCRSFRSNKLQLEMEVKDAENRLAQAKKAFNKQESIFQELKSSGTF